MKFGKTGVAIDGSKGRIAWLVCSRMNLYRFANQMLELCASISFRPLSRIMTSVLDLDQCVVFVDLDRIVEPLRATCTTKVKANSVKQEFEKQDELKRSALRAVAALLHIPDSGKNKCNPGNPVLESAKSCTCRHH